MLTPPISLKVRRQNSPLNVTKSFSESLVICFCYVPVPHLCHLSLASNDKCCDANNTDGSVRPHVKKISQVLKSDTFLCMVPVRYEKCPPYHKGITSAILTLFPEMLWQ